MRLTTHTDYALRTLMYLGATRARATIADIARLYGVSANHIAKVVNHLARLGYVRSVRGIGGGVELACDPDSITVGEIVEALEGHMHLLDCVATEDVCSIQSFCSLKGVLAEAERVQLDYLNTVTLTDVIPVRRQLQRVGLQVD